MERRLAAARRQLYRPARDIRRVGDSHVYLVQLNVLHMEMSGAGWQPIFSLHDPQRDVEALEQHRAEQRAAMPSTHANTDAAATPSEGAAALEPRNTARAEKSASIEDISGGRPEADATTNRDGYYTLSLAPDGYWLEARKAGYESHGGWLNFTRDAIVNIELRRQ